MHRIVLGIKDAGFTGEDLAFLAGNFGDRPAFREVSVEDPQVAVLFDRVG